MKSETTKVLEQAALAKVDYLLEIIAQHGSESEIGNKSVEALNIAIKEMVNLTSEAA